MELNPTLKAAIDSADLTTRQRRRGATALAIVLLDKIYSAEFSELDELEIILIRFPTFAAKESEDYEENLTALSSAVSTLYNAFKLYPLRRLGISNYIRELDQTFNRVQNEMLNPLIPDN